MDQQHLREPTVSVRVGAQPAGEGSECLTELCKEHQVQGAAGRMQTTETKTTHLLLPG